MFPLMLTWACIDPFSNHESELYAIFKFDQVLIISYSFPIIYCNIYLHKFLKTQNEKNASLKNEDKKKKIVRKAKNCQFSAI